MKILMSLGLTVLGLAAVASQALAGTPTTLTTGSHGAFALSRPGCGYNACSFAYFAPGSPVDVYGSVVGTDGRTYDVVYTTNSSGVAQTGYVLVSAFPGAAPIAPPKLIFGVGYGG